MWLKKKVVYLWSYRRRPVALYPDPEGSLPLGWCPDCGRELWEKADKCRQCREAERSEEDEKSL